MKKKELILNLLQLIIPILSIFLVGVFLRFNIKSMAQILTQEFERQSFVELSRGDTFLLARKLAPLAKEEYFSCVIAVKNKEVFFQEKTGDCGVGLFHAEGKIFEPNQNIEIQFVTRLPANLINGFATFIFIQFLLIYFLFRAQKMADYFRYMGEIELAASAKQVVHDIRSPLVSLATVSKEIEGAAGEKLQHSLQRLTDLIHHLSGKRTGKKMIRMQNLMDDLVREKRVEFSGKQMNITLNISGVENRVLLGDAFLWRRVVSNIFNNSVEASSGKAINICIEAKIQNQMAEITFRDEGKGMPRELVEKIGTKGLSWDKDGGSGLGFYLVKNFLSSIGGSFTVQSQIGSGTQVVIKAPILSGIVLIEDDQEITQLWERASVRCEIQLQSFASPEEFLANLHKMSPDLIIFSEDFPNSKIEISSFLNDLHKRGFLVFLCTGHRKEKWEHLPFISSVFGKEPPWL